MSKQENNAEAEELTARLQRFRISEGLTWREVGEKLGVGVSMLTMVLSGHRRLSAKAMYRLDESEKKAAQKRSGAEAIVEDLLDDKGSAKGLIERAGKGGKVDLPLEYKPARGRKALPDRVTLTRPPEQGCAKLQRLFAETHDTSMLVLACLPETLRSEGFLGRLAEHSRVRLTNAALDLVIPGWRTVVANATTQV